MRSLVFEKDRRIIPRWRTLENSIKNGELEFASATDIEDIYSDPFFKGHLLNWQENKSVSNALEIVNFSLISGCHQFAEEPINFLLENKDRVPMRALDIVGSFVNSPEEANFETINAQNQLNLNIIDAIRLQIAIVKKQIQKFQKNPVLWIELARLYTVLGIDEKAKKAVTVALAINSENRFILRSAARYFIHIDDPEISKHILVRSKSFKYDPWLLSSEIAVSSILGKTSNHIKKATQLIYSNTFSDSCISELASAVGTVELYSGSYKKAKKHFNKSLSKPNENSLAQAQWATSYIGALNFNSDTNVPNSFEVQAGRAYNSGEWLKAFEYCTEWMLDEPYSSRPARAGSYLSAALLDNYSEGEHLCRLALVSNRNDPSLKNNLCVLLAYQGKTEEAQEIFESIELDSLPKREQIISIATKGLLMYREGSVDVGRILYKEAIEKATKAGETGVAASAAIYLTREEYRLDSELAEQLHRQAEKFYVKTKSNALNAMLEKIKQFQPKSPSWRLSFNN